MNMLIKKLDGVLSQRRKEYLGAKLMRTEVVELSKQLPDFITSIDWYICTKREEKKWYLETLIVAEDEGDTLVRELKIWGAYGMKSHYKAFNNSWYFDCSAMVGDTEIIIKVDGGSKPPNCTIEEIKEVKEVITYKAVCAETGEEL